jgi:L-threonylcarbamoyladenylate synthase
MNTLYLSATEANTASTAANIIKNGGLVAIPTETVYGLGANGLDPVAVKKIFQAKGRPQDNPLILHIADSSALDTLCHSIPDCAYALAAAFWPGPLTMVLPARDIVPLSTRAGLPSVAVRCPDSDITREIIRLSGVPVAAPSANISGKPSTTTAEHVRYDHDGRIDCIVDGGPCRVGVESTIVDLTEMPPRLLRPGGITPEELEAVLGEITVDKAVTQALRADEVAKAPGMKYKHYAPQCEVVIVSGSAEAAARFVKRNRKPNDRVLCFEEELDAFTGCAPLAYGRENDPATLSAGLFAALRTLDDPAIGTVYARCPQGGGMACAVRNRLSKAAAFRVIDPTDGRFVIGITGGTGCGKTTLLNAIREKGGTVIDCDAVYHHLLETSDTLLAAIEAAFPGTVENGVLQRKKLGALVFADPEKLKKLSSITGPVICAEVRRLAEAAEGLAAIDAIGLFEGGLDKLCHTTVAVTAPTEARIARLMQRDGITEEYAKIRIAAQKDNAHYAALCAHTLENASTQAEFESKCLAFLNSLGIM